MGQKIAAVVCSYLQRIPEVSEETFLLFQQNNLLRQYNSKGYKRVSVCSSFRIIIIIGKGLNWQITFAVLINYEHDRLISFKNLLVTADDFNSFEL